MRLALRPDPCDLVMVRKTLAQTFGANPMSAISLPLRPGRTIREVTSPEPTKPAWDNIDPATLPEDLQKLYYAYLKAQATASDARKLFESECNEAFDVGPGNRLAFGYKFGRLSAAIVRDAPRSSASFKALTAIAKLR